MLQYQSHMQEKDKKRTIRRYVAKEELSNRLAAGP